MRDGAAPWRSCLIATLPRSGSWLLAKGFQLTGLAGHPEEYFRPDHRAFWLDEWGHPRVDSFADYVREALGYGTTDNGVFSAKLHWYQFKWLLGQLRAGPVPDALTDRELVERYLPQPRYVYLTRDDKARQAISYFRAIHTNEWFRLAGEERPADGDGPPLVPDFQQIRWLEDLVSEHDRNWERFFTVSGLQPLRLTYEQLCADFKECVEHVLNFIGIDRPADMAISVPDLLKQADELTEHWLEIYLAVRHRMEPKSELVQWFNSEKRFRHAPLPAAERKATVGEKR